MIDGWGRHSKGFVEEKCFLEILKANRNLTDLIVARECKFGEILLTKKRGYNCARFK